MAVKKKEIPLEGRSCANCSHYLVFNQIPHRGSCRRFPPTAMWVEGRQQTDFPSVHNTSLCGEHLGV